MKQKIITTAIVCMMLFAMIPAIKAQETTKKIRIGVYDNRAIALAYFGSEYNPLMQKQVEFKAAKEAGDSARIKELELWGPKFQRQLQFQGFCRVPVDDLLAFVKDRLSEVAEEAEVDVIGWYPDFVGSGIVVEKVDITDKLIALFNPSDKVLYDIEIALKVKPTDLGDIKQINYDKR